MGRTGHSRARPDRSTPTPNLDQSSQPVSMHDQAIYVVIWVHQLIYVACVHAHCGGAFSKFQLPHDCICNLNLDHLGKTIHVLNKNEHALDLAAPAHDNLGDPNGSSNDYSLVEKRTNMLLLGDHIGDQEISDGLNYVGFL